MSGRVAIAPRCIRIAPLCIATPPDGVLTASASVAIVRAAVRMRAACFGISSARVGTVRARIATVRPCVGTQTATVPMRPATVATLRRTIGNVAGTVATQRRAIAIVAGTIATLARALRAHGAAVRTHATIVPMPDTERYAPAERLHTLRNLLASRACTIPEIVEELAASESTVRRLLRALERAGEPLTEETRDDRRKTFRVVASGAKTVTVRLTAAQLATLVLARKAVSFLEGTGFDADLDDVVAQLSVTLRETDAALAKNLETKIFDVNEHPHDYEGREDDVDEIITALMREERLHVRHGSVRRGEERFAFEPYSLVLYKKGLYFAGLSGWHGRIVTFALDGFRSVERARGERFAYPKGWEPKSVVGNAFGLIGGPTTRVRIWFAKEVARHVRRRRWHATRSYEKVDDGVVLTMEVGGTKELTSWVLGWGSQAKVLEPSSLQAEVAAEIAKMGARYAT